MSALDSIKSSCTADPIFDVDISSVSPRRPVMFSAKSYHFLRSTIALYSECLQVTQRWDIRIRDERKVHRMAPNRC